VLDQLCDGVLETGKGCAMCRTKFCRIMSFFFALNFYVECITNLIGTNCMSNNLHICKMCVCFIFIWSANNETKKKLFNEKSNNFMIMGIFLKRTLVLLFCLFWVLIIKFSTSFRAMFKLSLTIISYPLFVKGILI
jgi:hypothetical protein